MMLDCPQCGEGTEALHEGYCEPCREIARDVELMEKYGHMTIGEWNEMLHRYDKALIQIRDHYDDTALAAKHMAAIARAVLSVKDTGGNDV